MSAGLALLCALSASGPATGTAPDATGTAPAATGAAPAAGAATTTRPSLPEATPLALDVQVQPEEVALGDHIHVRIAVTHEPRDVYSLPDFDPSPLSVPQGAQEVFARREEAGGSARTIFEMTLADYTTTEPRLPDLTLHVSGPAGERVLNLRGRPLRFKSLLRDDAAAAHAREPKPPQALFVRSFLWLYLLLGVGALAAALLLWRRLRKHGARPKIAAPAPPLPHELALQRLQALRRDAPWSRGQGRAAIFTLSEVVRAYLGARLAFNALDLTSDELLEALGRTRLAGLDLGELQGELRWEDLVKFAKVEPSPEECLRGIGRAEALVRHTRPAPAEGPGAAA